jgi:tetratricopeptide (TPR) repeat protein
MKSVTGRDSVFELGRRVRKKLAEISDVGQRSKIEDAVGGWLYDFIRANVKRGRFFDLRDVLSQGRADCLGYAKLFTLLGRVFGLDAGVIEAVIDNAGRYVPHTACLVKLADGQLRFVDLWYGSKNIEHQRMGLRVRRGRVWRIEDLTPEEVYRQEVSYLPDSCVNGITQYIFGNRHLNRKDFRSAIECYSEAIRLYPQNARFYYNRAVAYENLGEPEKAKADYARALRDDASIIRVLATEHEEITRLIEQD